MDRKQDGSRSPPPPTSLDRAASSPMERPSAAAAVAKAPSKESLYESLLRYHESDSDEESEQQNGAIADEDDRKPAAKPAAQERPAMDKTEKDSSFYKSAQAAASVRADPPGTPPGRALYPATSPVLKATKGNVVPEELQNAPSLMTAETRRVAAALGRDDLEVLQQISELSVNDTAVGLDADPEQVKLWQQIKNEQTRKEQERDEQARKEQKSQEQDPELAELEQKIQQEQDPEQIQLWQKIQEERERKQLEEVLRESKMESGGGTVDFVPHPVQADIPREYLADHFAAMHPSSGAAVRPRDTSADFIAQHVPESIPARASPADFLLSQQMAMEEWRQAQGGSGVPPGGAQVSKPTSHQQRSDGFVPPQRGPPLAGASVGGGPSNEALLLRGHYETREAIANGKAHVVQCRGCLGRLHAPMSYSLVFCPKCKTVSPGQTFRSTPPSKKKTPRVQNNGV